MDNMITAILKIARRNPEGFTILIPSLTPVKKGWAVAFEATQNSFDIEGLQKVIQHALTHQSVIGGWKEDNKFYFDSIMIIEDEQQAFEMGRDQKQIAIYQIETNRLEFL